MRVKVLMGAVMAVTVSYIVDTNAQESVEHKALKKGDVPQAVLQSFEKDHPQAKSVAYEEEVREGTPYYGVEYKTKGKEEEFVYSADGKLVEQHEGIGVKAVPAVVRQAVKREHPHAAVKEAEKVMNPDKSVIGYEMDIKEGKQHMELVFDPSGKLLRQGTIGGPTRHL